MPQPPQSDCYVRVTVTPELPSGAHPASRAFSIQDRAHGDRAGHLLVFIEVDLPNETSPTRESGARSYLFFPRTHAIGLRQDPIQSTVSLTLPNGEDLRFDSSTGRIRDYSGASVTESAEITLSNRGGVEFGTPRAGLILDCGWKRGESALSVSSNRCRFKDRQGNTCEKTVGALFRYQGDNPVFRFPTDDELAAFLSRECRGLATDWREPPQSHARAHLEADTPTCDRSTGTPSPAALWNDLQRVTAAMRQGA